MLPLLAELTADPATVTLLADSDSGAGSIAIPLLAGPAVLLGVSLGIYRYYRNTDKRHHFERETAAQQGNLETGRRKIGENNRQQSHRMRARNRTDHPQPAHRTTAD